MILGHRLLRAAGGRGLARAALRPPAAAHARVRRRACGWRWRASASSSTARRSSCRCPDGPGKALKLTIAPVQARDPDLCRGDRPQEHGADRRDRRRLAADAVLARSTWASSGRCWRRASRAAGGGKGFADFEIVPTVSRKRVRRPGGGAGLDARLPRACTSAGWARASRTSTTRSCSATGSRTRRSGSRTCTWRGAREEAAAALPGELIDTVSLVGPADRVRERLAVYREAGVGTLMVSPMAWSLEERLGAAAHGGRAGWRDAAGADLRHGPLAAGDGQALSELVDGVRPQLSRLGARGLERARGLAGLGAAVRRARPLVVLRVRRRRRHGRRSCASGRRGRARRPGSTTARCSTGVAHVGAVFVHPARWRQGIAAALLRAGRAGDAGARLHRRPAVDAGGRAGRALLRGARLAARRARRRGTTWIGLTVVGLREAAVRRSTSARSATPATRSRCSRWARRCGRAGTRW